jgi:hypothetical protein
MRRWKLYFNTSKTTIQVEAKYIPAFKPGKQLQAVVMDKVSKASCTNRAGIVPLVVDFRDGLFRCFTR